MQQAEKKKEANSVALPASGVGVGRMTLVATAAFSLSELQAAAALEVESV
jgi:hypothetical protein